MTKPPVTLTELSIINQLNHRYDLSKAERV